MREFVFISYQPYVYRDHSWGTVGLYSAINISLHASLVSTYAHFIYLCMIVMV